MLAQIGVSSNKPNKSKFATKFQQESTPQPNIDENLDLENLENITKPSRSRSTYDKNRPTFLQKKQIKLISCENNAEIDRKSLSPLKSTSPMSPLIVSPLIASPLMSTGKKNPDELKKSNSQSSVKLKSEIKTYNDILLWASIISETCQKLSDEMKIPDSNFFFKK